MAALNYEIRLCLSCGLRYPLTDNHPFGTRCPSCLGKTKILRSEQIENDAARIGDILPRAYKIRAFLDNIRSAWNVGSILRTSDGYGFEHAYLCGITPTPEQAEVRKTALGAGGSVTWSKHPNGLDQVVDLRKSGWQIIALENGKGSIPIQIAANRIIEEPFVLVVGNERTGVDPDILALADHVVHIPMHGQKKSFNVAVAFAVAAALIYNELTQIPR